MKSDTMRVGRATQCGSAIHRQCHIHTPSRNSCNNDVKPSTLAHVIVTVRSSPSPLKFQLVTTFLYSYYVQHGYIWNLYHSPLGLHEMIVRTFSMELVRYPITVQGKFDLSFSLKFRSLSLYGCVS